MATATAIESPSIASAREKAASILYGNEKPITPIIAEYDVTVKEEPKAKPTFSTYYHVETVKAPRPTQFRSYETVAEPVTMTEPQVVRPFIDSTTMPVPTVTATTNVAPVAVTSKSVASELDVELEEDTQYVVKFKPTTLLAGAAMAVVFVLMTVLLIVNMVSISTCAATIGKLAQEEQVLTAELETVTRECEAARQEVNAAVNSDMNNYENLNQYAIAKDNVEFYTPHQAPAKSGGLFNWLCQTLNHLFG